MERSTSIGGHVVAQLSISFSTKVEIDRTITEPAGRTKAEYGL